MSKIQQSCSPSFGWVGLLVVFFGLCEAPLSFAHAPSTQEANTLPAAVEPVSELPLEPQPSPNGLYPIWESDGRVLPNRGLVLGVRRAQFGIADRLHLNMDIGMFISRTPNMGGRLSLWRDAKFATSLQVMGYLALPGAYEPFWSSSYQPRFAPPKSVFMLPVSFAHSIHLTPWLKLHNTSTILGVAGKAIETDGVVGHFATLEMNANLMNSLFLHVGEVGFWRHEFLVMGASYRFFWSWFEARIGYYFRVHPDGVESQPLFDMQVVL